MRMFQAGFEVNGSMMWTGAVAGSSYTIGVDATAAIHGNYGLHCQRTAAGNSGTNGCYWETRVAGGGVGGAQPEGHQYVESSGLALPFFFRFYLDHAINNGTLNIWKILEFFNTTPTSALWVGTILSGGVRYIRVNSNTGVALNVYAYSLNTVYRIEGRVTSTAITIEVYTETGTTLLGAQSLAFSSSVAGDVNVIRFGMVGSPSQNQIQEMYLDDLAINDASTGGSNIHNSWCWAGHGSGLVVPNAANTAQFKLQAGGADGSAVYTEVDEWTGAVAPDDATTYNRTPTGGTANRNDKWGQAGYGGANTVKSVLVMIKSADSILGGSGGGNHYAGLDDGGTVIRGIYALYGTGGGDTTYRYQGLVIGERAAGGAWTNAAFNAALVQYERYTVGSSDNVAQKDVTAISIEVEDDGGVAARSAPPASVRRRFGMGT